MTVAERVRTGAAFLDQRWPAGAWVARVDVFTLDLRNPRYCILGQLYGDFTTGSEVLQTYRVAGYSSYGYGFDSSKLLSGEEERMEDYNNLRRAWRAEIFARRAKPLVEQA